MAKRISNTKLVLVAVVILGNALLMFSPSQQVPLSNEDSQQRMSVNTVLSSGGELFKQVAPSIPIQFPQDHSAHDDYQYEWWYLTANLVGESGKEYGVQWTQFRVASEIVEDPQSSWSTNQIYMAHSAITTQDKHYTSEKWSRAHPQLAAVEPEPFSAFIDDWRWQSSSQDLFPASLTVADAALNQAADSPRYSYQLQLDSSAPYQLQGDEGYSIKSAGGEVSSYYYNQPYINISGVVTVGGIREKVSGHGWLDREWSSQFILRSQQGWDWFALRLTDQLTLVLFQLRPAQSSEGDGMVGFSSARLMHIDGNGFHIAGSEINLTPIATENDYPVQWQLSIPRHDINLSIDALNPRSSMDLSIPYWEGPVRFSGSHQGRGYLEMTGY